jgi:hypothetical protein
MNHKKIIDDLSKTAQQITVDTGGHDLMVFCINGEGAIFAAIDMANLLQKAEVKYESGDEQSGDNIKDKMAFLIKDAVSQINPVGVIVISEAWCSSSRKDKDEMIRPRESENRYEAVVLSYEIRGEDDIHRGTVMMPFVRTKGDKIKFLRTSHIGESDDTKDNTSGRLTHILSGV